MSAADYFADPCPVPSLTQSLAKLLIARSPLHAKCAHPRLNDTVEEEEVERYEKAKAIGSAAHLTLIGRGKDILVADFDAWRTNEAKKVRAEAEAEGRMAILRHHFDLAVTMVEAARQQLADVGFTDTFSPDLGNGEVCVAWEEDGIWFRSLIDWLPTTMRVVWDYKTSEMSVAPHSIGRMMADAGWDVQAAMHERGLARVTQGVESIGRRFRFVAQEQEPPYALTICELPESVLAVGRKKLDYAVRLWTRCMRSGEWPAYPAEVCVPEYPAWAEAAWLNREIHEAARERHGSRDAGNLMAG